MVVFACDKCGDSVKKPQVEKHRQRCGHQVMFCCIDCQKPFYGDEYKAHTKCVSEAQKYGGLNYVPKENKGEVKQDAWTEQVQTAIGQCPGNDGPLRQFMAKLVDYPNVPRKEKKFGNFCVNSISRDRSLIGKAWALIVAAAPAKPAHNGTTSTTATNGVGDKRPADDEGADSESPPPKLAKADAVKWKRVLRSALKAHTGERSMTKDDLRAVVFDKVGEAFETEAVFDVLFEEKVRSTKGLLVETIVRFDS